MDLPIDRIRSHFESELQRGAVVLSSPTGSGKSTQVPRWCAARHRVLVVEPRRVACRALATRVADLERSRLGDRVGYIVRDDRRANDRTQVVFATPGIVLQMLANDRDLASFDCVVVDEFHERGMDVDLILALLLDRPPKALIVMSATIDGDRLAHHIGGVHVSAEGRTHPVQFEYAGAPADLPHGNNLASRIRRAVLNAPSDGDILVFVPGKAEIQRSIDALKDAPVDALPLHGGLSLDEQSRVFTPGRRRRVIVSTNVAETSLTVPSVRVVIDSGLVRRTRYHQGRGYLTLMPIALDSADQRAGRAGRVSAGTCIRLWGRAARLEARTPPEVHRESVVPLVLGARVCGATADSLRLPDPPPDHALTAAYDELHALGALADRALTQRGRRLFKLPVSPELGRLLIEGLDTPFLDDVIDLVAALDIGRPLFTGAVDEESDLRRCGCDATALVTAVRQGRPRQHGLSGFVLQEIRHRAKRLREAFDRPARIPQDVPERLSAQLVTLALAADPRTAHVKRQRKRHVAWSNGGTEIELSDRSAIHVDDVDGIVVLAVRPFGVDQRKTRLVATCALPVTRRMLAAAGLGRPRLGRLSVDNGRPVATTEQVYAGKVLTTHESELEDELLRQAVTTLTLEGRLFRKLAPVLRTRLRELDLVRRLIARETLPSHAVASPDELTHAGHPEQWLQRRLEVLGLTHVDELDLIERDDLLPAELPEVARHALDRDWPTTVDLGDTAYEVGYDFTRRIVTLNRVKGDRKDLPSVAYLPKFRGFGIEVVFRGKRRVLRAR